MAISVFPAGGGEFVTNDFVVDMNDTNNNVIDLGRAYASGAYDVSLASGDTSFDIYAVDADGNSVGYTKDATLVTTGEFTTLAILGVATDERITFAFAGASNDATSEGDATGAGAYLESVSPTDLPNIDDTTNVVGGNFATDVEIYFESGAVSTLAKEVTRADSQNLIVTRPDQLDPALDPWDVKAINPGVTPPTGTNAHILSGTVDAGAVPVWTTTSPLPNALLNEAYSATVVATDADGDVTYSVSAGSLPSGLSLNGATGVISGTATAAGSETFTLTAEDEGGNSNDREFSLSVLAASGGVVSTSGNFTVHTFDSSSDFEVYEELTNVEYIILGGGGGGGGADFSFQLPGGGGGGAGLLSSISGFNSGQGTSALASETFSAGTYAVTIGAGGSGGVASAAGNNLLQGNNGSDTILATIGTAVGGGHGGSQAQQSGEAGGSGGGATGNNGNAGAGTTGQGFSGGNDSEGSISAGGGGTGAVGGNAVSNTSGSGGTGTHNFLDQRGWGAGGGGGSEGAPFNIKTPGSGGGSTGNNNSTYAGNGGSFNSVLGNSAVSNFGGGGGGAGGQESGSAGDGGDGGSGKVVIRYEA